VRYVLVPAAGLYSSAVKLRAALYSAGVFPVRRLNHPVISIGNLTVGGSGKTPLCAAVTAMLAQRGFKPAILTRGYGRQDGPRLVAIAPASQRDPDSRQVGDEPALLARAMPEIPVVVCADRYRGGRYAEEQFGVGIHILDDGFQHRALHREVDIVALDVTQPFFDEWTLPAGRLREPVSNLRRAQIVILTRSGGREIRSIESHLQAINPRLQIFRSQTVLQGFLDVRDNRFFSSDSLPRGPFLAFCGIGNPSAFFDDLARWGLKIKSTFKFPDHHRYTQSELGKLVRAARASSAAALVTTEKDLMNLPRRWQPALPLFACRIEARLTDPGHFEQVLLGLLKNCRSERSLSGGS
jgi:tetraacyldisaccharide 4'-kinase